MISPAQIARVSHPIRFLGRYRGWLIPGMCCLLLTNGLAQTIPWLVRRIIDSVHRISDGDGTFNVVTWSVLALVGVAVLQASIRVFSRVLIFNAGRTAEYDLRKMLLNHFLNLDSSFHRRHRVGDLISAMTNDLSAVRALFGPGVLYAVNTLIAFSMAVPLMLHIDVHVTLCALIPFPFLAMGTRFVARRVHTQSQSLQQSLADMTAVVQEDLSAIREIKSYTLEEARATMFGTISAGYKRQAIVAELWESGIAPIAALGAGTSALLVLWVGGLRVIAGTLSLGDLIAMNLYVGLLAYPTVALGWILSSWQRGMAAWQRLGDLCREQSALPGEIGAETLIPVGDAATPVVRVDHLTVELAGRRILNDVSFAIPRGQICAVVGRIGSGKTILVEALARLVPVARGQIFFQGKEINDLDPSAVRREIGYAPQDTFLFSASVANNIAYGLPDGLTTAERDARIAQAIQVAGLESDIEALPRGIQTWVGEGGLALSGGQRQRVALARALVSDRQLLIFDDSLAAVDAETEKQILEALRRALRNSTALLISHRLTALQNADQIIVLGDHGDVVQRGSHATLINEPGLYRDLYQRQLWNESIR